MKTGFIGAGKVGFTLGKFFKEKGNLVTGYYSRNTNSAKEAANFTNTKAYNSIKSIVDDSDVLFLTVPDGSISSVYEEISAFPIRGKYICHCSGAKTALEAFPSIDKKGAYEFSVHPLFAVSDKYNAYKELSDVFFTVEGNRNKLPIMLKFLEGMKLSVHTLESSHKTKYHASAVISSNLVIGLLWESLSLLKECGFSMNDALHALTPLVMGNVKHILKDGPEKALTGPVERGDLETISHHISCFTKESTREIYSLLSKNLIEIAEGKHPERDYSELETFLNQNGECK